MGWDGTGWDGMGWDGMAWHGLAASWLYLGKSRKGTRHGGVPSVRNPTPLRLGVCDAEVGCRWSERRDLVADKSLEAEHQSLLSK